MTRAPEAAPRDALTGRRVPLSTYRVQLNRHFTFHQAADLVCYLHELGIGDLYASPPFNASAASLHGYDVCGFDALNSRLGGPSGFEVLHTALREHRLGLVVDMVPNHMGTDAANQWWQDVLERGPSSPYGSWFDIHWQAFSPDGPPQVLLPVLEDHYSEVLESGKLHLEFSEGRLAVAYHDKRFPLSPAAYVEILLGLLEHRFLHPRAYSLARHLQPLIDARLALTRGRERGAESYWTPAELEHFDCVKQQVARWHLDSAGFRDTLERFLRGYCGHAGDPRSFDRLDSILRLQHYRLAWWAVGPEEINYRRFFDVSDLVCLRAEKPEVFAATHALLLDLLRKGIISGVRIDHPDGLRDPFGYLERLRAAASEGTQESTLRRGAYVVVEKILTGTEALPENWPVDGTTGYDFLCLVNGIFIDTGASDAFTELYRSFTGEDRDFGTVLLVSKRVVLSASFAGDLAALALLLKRVSAASRYTRDFTLSQLREALEELIVGFPVYRSYVRAEAGTLAEGDRRLIQEAARAAAARLQDRGICPSNGGGALEYVRKLLLLEYPADLPPVAAEWANEFVMRFQQITGPVMAKGAEDTAFYRYFRLISVNEVGGDPSRFGVSLADFHEHNRRKCEQWPHSLLATATHDTKRGEDVRARLNVLSEIPERWGAVVRDWSQFLSRRLTTGRQHADSASRPDSNDEYLFYQTLVGVWPAVFPSAEDLPNLRERMSAYMLKAARESKRHTSWTRPDEAYESALREFLGIALEERENEFLESFRRFHLAVDYFGRFNSYSQTLLKLTSPGVPDLYQGCELWDFSLVDPDNRRPVRFDVRRKALDELKARVEAAESRLALVRALVRDGSTGLAKLYVTWQALQFRSMHRELFDCGDYSPLEADGDRARHICAFMRSRGAETAVVIVPRFCLTLAGGQLVPPLGPELWGRTLIRLPSGLATSEWRNVFTGTRVSPVNLELRLGDVLTDFPVALLAQ